MNSFKQDILPIDAIRALYIEDPNHAEKVIEEFISRNFSEKGPSERLEALKELVGKFRRTSGNTGLPTDESKSLSRLAALLLGSKADEVDFSSPLVLEKLADTINVVFDAINDIILGINATFSGSQSETETIRLVISSQIGNYEDGQSLLSFLDQIKEAFALSLEAFKVATQKKLTELLNELSPKKIAELSTDSKLQVGPFRKAEFFATYERKFKSLERILNSGVLLEKFVREFEKSCQELYIRKGRKT